MTKNILIPLVIVLCIVLPSAAQAILPVYDASTYVQMLNQLNQMSKDYQTQLEQLQQAASQTSALTGPRNMGSLANSPLEAQLKQYLPNTWQETMSMIGASGLTGEAAKTQGLTSSLYATYNPVTGAAFVASDPTGPVAQAIDRRTATTYASMAASEQAYNNIAYRTNTYQTLLTELNNTTDVKTSVDLLARIEAENGMTETEIMRLNAIRIQQQAAEDSETLTSYTRAHDANQYDPAAAATAFQIKE